MLPESNTMHWGLASQRCNDFIVDLRPQKFGLQTTTTRRVFRGLFKNQRGGLFLIPSFELEYLLSYTNSTIVYSNTEVYILIKRGE